MWLAASNASKKPFSSIGIAAMATADRISGKHLSHTFDDAIVYRRQTLAVSASGSSLLTGDRF